MRFGQRGKSVSFFDRTLAIKPDDDIALQSRIFSLDFGYGDDALRQAARSEWWRRIGAPIAAKHPPHHENKRDPDRRIVLGYVSGDFRHHSSARAFRPVLTNHDKSQFEIGLLFHLSDIGPCDGLLPACCGSVERRPAMVRRSAGGWHPADKIDILIDLSGHTRGNRLRVFARKPAPIQVTAWGHGSGTGMPMIDYLFTDPSACPRKPAICSPNESTIFRARSSSNRRPAATRLRAARGFERICHLRRLYAGEPDVRAGHKTLGRILRADVTSQLILKDRLLDDISIQTRLKETFAAHGVTPDRLSLMGSTSREEHLAAYRLIDIGLDPFPHGGGVSTWESLYMGVPVVTKLGHSQSTRVGGAILSAIGMTDWIAGDDDEYVDIALRSTPDRLREIREQLPDLIARAAAPRPTHGRRKQRIGRCGRSGAANGWVSRLSSLAWPKGSGDAFVSAAL